MTVNPVTYPSVSGGSSSMPQAVATDEPQTLKQKEASEAKKPQSSGIPDHRRFDIYEKGDGKLSASETGIYHPSADDTGTKDDPAGSGAPQKADGSGSPEDEPKITQCTTNTDKVDAEIKRLKEEKKQILQQLRKADGDAERQAALEKRLAQLEAELQLKDNDAYRKQHATHTTGKAE